MWKIKQWGFIWSSVFLLCCRCSQWWWPDVSPLVQSFLFPHRKCNKLLFTHFQWGEGAWERLCCPTSPKLFFFLFSLTFWPSCLLWVQLEGSGSLFFLVWKNAKQETSNRQQMNETENWSLILLAHFFANSTNRDRKKLLNSPWRTPTWSSAPGPRWCGLPVTHRGKSRSPGKQVAYSTINQSINPSIK